MVRKVEAGAEEPLGRQLFREAWSQVGTNPRSGLVIGVTAAEVGLIKTNRYPDTGDRLVYGRDTDASGW